MLLLFPEITKDSSRSSNEYSDDEFDTYSSSHASSNKPSPVSDLSGYDLAGTNGKPRMEGPQYEPDPRDMNHDKGRARDRERERSGSRERSASGGERPGSGRRRRSSHGSEKFSDGEHTPRASRSQSPSRPRDQSPHRSRDTSPNRGHHRDPRLKGQKGPRDPRGMPALPDKRSPRTPREMQDSRSPRSRKSSLSDAEYNELDNNDVISPMKIRDDIPDSELIDYEDEGESIPEEIDLDFDENHIRIFIALFDYDPMTMSPNPDASDEELPFKEGQLIKVSKSGLKYSSTH